MESSSSQKDDILSSTIQLTPTKPDLPLTCTASLYDSLRLDSARSAIRLLVLQPARWNSPLQAEMQVAYLTNNPLYDTLSYVWGKEDPNEYSHSIQINEVCVPISHSLFDALQDVRLHNGNVPLTIWVDALCIDQASIAEKNQQIPLMGKIYSCCQKVHIAIEGIGKYMFPPGEAWSFTGDDDDYGPLWNEYAKHFIFKDNNYSKASILSPSTHYQFDLFIAWIFRELADANHLTDVSAFLPILQSHSVWHMQVKHAMVTLGFSQWFERLWIVQEATLPPAGYVYLGSVSMPLHIMIAASSNYRFHMQNGCCPVPGLSRNAVDENFAKICDQFVSLESLRRSQTQHPSLFELSLQFMKRKATVAHDLAYALLGLAHSDIAPDYKAGLMALFTEVSAEHIKITDSLLPMSFAGLSSSIHGLPTWVANLQLPGVRGHPNPPSWDWFMQIPSFNSCGDLVQGSGLKIEHNRLHLLGIEFDRIVTISPDISAHSQDIISSLSNYNISLNPQHQNELDSVTAGSESDGYPGGGTWKNAWWRTLLRDHCWGSAQSENASDRHISTLCALAMHNSKARHGDLNKPFEYISNLRDVGATFFTGVDRVSDGLLLETIREHVLWQTMDRRLFLTAKGYLGMAKNDILEQDSIFVLPSSSVPIVLRPVGSHVEAAASVYANVGDCYLHGIMNGEVARACRNEARQIIVV